MAPGDVLSTEQAAVELGISADRVRALIGAQRLPAYKLSREWAIMRKDLERVRVRRPGRPKHESSPPIAHAVEETSPPVIERRHAGGERNMKVLAVGSQKGGVSKSTTTLFLATRAAALSGGTAKRPTVGILDRDESKNLTELLRLRPELLRPGVVLLKGDTLPPPSAGLQLIVIDTPPGLSAIQSLREAHLVLVPVHPEDQGVANLVKYLRGIEAQRLTVSPGMRLVALLPAMVERTVLHRERLQDIRDIAAHYRPPLTVLSPVPRRARIAAFDLDAPEFALPARELFDNGLIDQTASSRAG
jgi:excisionase family DNA binding protein